jgi:hypothetical protein
MSGEWDWIHLQNEFPSLCESDAKELSEQINAALVAEMGTTLSKLPATGEWTVSPIGEILHNGACMATAFTYVQGKACVDAINAALAAEREELAIVGRSRDAWQKQVAGLTEARQPLVEKITELEGRLSKYEQS